MNEKKVLDILNKINACLKQNSINKAIEYTQLEIDNLKGVSQEKCKNTKYYYYDYYCKYCDNLNCNSNKKTN